jgi:hypothetical protein
MAPAMKAGLWVVAILVVAYALNINVLSVVTGFMHGIQQMHNARGGH